MRSKMRKKKMGYFVVVCLFLLVLMTGCKEEKPQREASPAADASQSSENTSSDHAGKTDSEGTPDAGVSEEMELEKAKSAVLQDAGLTEDEVSFTKSQREYDDGMEVYEFEFVTAQYEYEYEVRAADAQILKSSKEELHNKSAGNNSENTQDKEYITEEAAKAAALERAQLTEGQVKFGKVEFEYDDGVAQYEIEFYADGMEYDCIVHAVSGEVIEMEKERM